MTYLDLAKQFKGLRNRRQIAIILLRNAKRNKAAGEGQLPERHAHQVPAQVLGSIIPVMRSVE